MLSLSLSIFPSLFFLYHYIIYFNLFSSLSFYFMYILLSLSLSHLYPNFFIFLLKRNDSLPIAVESEWPRCGDTNSKGVYMNIVSRNAEHANFGEFPWIVGVFRKSNVFLTGGSLIASRVVLSTAMEVNMLTDLKVRAGDWDIATENEILPYQEREVNRTVSMLAQRNNIALLILKAKFNLVPHIGLICLPENGLFNLGSCRVVGWNDRLKRGRQLMTSMTMNLMKCANGTADGLICGKGHQRTLKYATGAALVCPKINESDDRYYQVGIWSHGDGIDANIMFTNVTKFLTWIQDETARF